MIFVNLQKNIKRIIIRLFDSTSMNGGKIASRPKSIVLTLDREGFVLAIALDFGAHM
jgi:hypothetical protein